MIKVGEARASTNQDFEYLKELCEKDEGWQVDFDKKKFIVLSQKNDVCKYSMIKVKTQFDDVSAEVLYESIQDDQFRPKWDKNILNYVPICKLSSDTLIAYECIKCPRPMKDRDFVRLCSWKDYGPNNIKLIYSYSVNHQKYPVTSRYVRGVVYMAVLLIQPISANSCSFIYLLQSDIGSSLPVSLINKLVKVFTPKVLKQIHKASLKYAKWKPKNNPSQKPWLNLDTTDLKSIDWRDISELDTKLQNNADESNLKDDLEIDDSDDDDKN